MQKEQFENRIRSLLPQATDKAVTAWTAYANEIVQEGVETESDFYDKNYVELSLIKQHYGEEIPTQLFNYGEHFVHNYFDLRGAAARLAAGWPLEKIEKCSIKDGYDATQEEHEEFAATLRAFQESEQASPDTEVFTMTKKQLEDKLYARMSAENEAFLADLKTKPVDEIISHAYEIARRDDFLMLFEDETPLNQRQLEVLMEFDHPLSVLYEDWINRDSDEMEQLRDSMKSCADDILRDRAEKKYSDPTQPMYGKSRQEAYACDELTEWGADHRRSVECARLFQKEGGTAYHEQTFPAFLQKWETDFGKERCMFVLACTMQQRTGDERFYLPAREAAAKFKKHLERAGNRISNYSVNTHSCIVNEAMEQLARPERSKEVLTAQKKKQQPER